MGLNEVNGPEAPSWTTHTSAPIESSAVGLEGEALGQAGHQQAHREDKRGFVTAIKKRRRRHCRSRNVACHIIGSTPSHSPRPPREGSAAAADF